MPSISQIEEGLPVLTGFSLQHKKNGENELFQNGISNGIHKKHHAIEKFESENNIILSERNGNHYTNGNGVAYSNGNGAAVDLANGNGYHDETDRAQVLKSESLTNGMANGIHISPAEKTSINASVPATAKTPSVNADPEDPSISWKKDGVIYNKGPDQILPSEALYTWHSDGAVRISRLGSGEMADRTPMSVPSLLQRAAQRAPERMALAVKRNGEWQKWTYKQYLRDVRTAAKGFIALGLEKYHSVGILGFNSPEWFISDLAAIFAGGFAAGIYTTNSPEACAFVAKDSKANILIVEDEKQLEKMLRYRNELPYLKAIIQYTGEPKEPGVYSWSKLMMLGSQQPDDVLEDRLRHIAINQCCTLIYTSGTTGNPKGVMLSHDNMTWLAHINGRTCNFRDFVEEYISFLPLSHVAAQMADVYCPLTCSASVYFADKNALKGSLIDTMREIKPTKFLAVPRVWEKMYEKMQDIGRSTTGVKKMIATWAKAKGLDYNIKRMNGVENPETLGFKIANKLILSKIRDALGLTRCDLHLSGAAPINPEILKYFMSLNIVVTEVYGMSECSGPHAMAVESAFRVGSVGKTLMGVTTRLDKPDADGNGEICMGGRHVQMGYLNQPEKTQGAIDENGWLHSEDIGRVDDDGFLFITGRIKELLITAGGENVAPVPIEDNVKTALPILSQAMLLGDKLKFLSILLTLKTEVDKETQEPLDTLLPFTRDWIQKNGDCAVVTVQDALKEIYEKKNQKLISAIQAGIDAANKKAVSQAQKVQKWHFLPKDFSIPGGEFGPTLKLKRQTVVQKYQETIDELYNV
ncbi:Long-chain-fatty-acid--CoA ligase ACSBG2 [Orchesella cincta]|uniref:long-chain-fatty-acid--CoA ligase n=1 Tax=Orchesella cincta TaxID=48709 RepID=A0A1D2N604_ORCCI|nr:Long-chain-fatty-acid--CoA ligase ACSBG2 [Orchesella cincta]